MRLCRMVASDAVIGLAQGSVAVAVGPDDCHPYFQKHPDHGMLNRMEARKVSSAINIGVLLTGHT